MKVYVYYRVDATQHEAVAQRVRDFQLRMLATWPGLQGELLQRPDLRDGQETWMETWHHPQGLGDDWLQALQQAAEAAALPAPRHTERFVPLR